MNYIYHYNFSIGKITITENEGFITSIGFSKETDFKNHTFKETPLIKDAALQIDEFLNGLRKNFNLL